MTLNDVQARANLTLLRPIQLQPPCPRCSSILSIFTPTPMFEGSYPEAKLEDKDCSFGARPALPVSDGEPDWDCQSPDTAEEYLKRVRWEAAQCPQTTKAELDVSVFDTKRTEYISQFKPVADAPGYCKPTIAWIKQSLIDFQKLRRYFESLDEDCLVGTTIYTKVPETEEPVLDSGVFEISPTLDSIGALDQVETSRSLKFHISEFLKLKLEEISDIRWFWLYALLSRIHRPLHDTTSAAVRSLFLHCAELRSHFSTQITSGHFPDNTLPQINLILSISGVYFGQDEVLSGIVDIDDI